jgi:predicted  nucleic acid-binding Zn-ribbon protein
LEGEKYKLITAHKDEMEKKDFAFEKVRVELSAWKLEMQNALNDIEGLKREKMELEQQIAVYKSSLDALSSANQQGELGDFVSS